MKFVRYGNLKAQQHDRPKSKEDWSLHTPPTEYGFYAFPKGYEEPFLIGGIGSGNVQNGRFHFLRDSSGNKIQTTSKALFSDDYDKDYNNYLREPYKSIIDSQHISYKDIVLYVTDEDGVYDSGWHPFKKGYIAVRNKRTEFNYTGNIWHHLYEDSGKIIIKPVDILAQSGEWVLTDIRTYEKALKQFVHNSKSWLMFDKWTGPSKKGPADGMPLCFDKDIFEVYIEDIQKENKIKKK